MKVTIIGIGLIGGSIARSLRSSGFASQIIGVEQNPEHGRQALALQLVDEVLPLEAAVAAADLILVSTPVNTLTTLLPRVLGLIRQDQVVLDVGSTKVPVLAAVAGHALRRRFVATHPMAGTEYSGPASAVEGLFNGKRCVFSNVLESDPDAVQTARQLYEALGMTISLLDAAEHDLHVAYVSHISHIASFALALTVLDKEKAEDRIFELAGGGFSSTARLAKSNADTWVPIFAQNRENVLDVLDEFINTASRFRTLLIKKDFAQFESMIRQANDIGRILDK